MCDSGSLSATRRLSRSALTNWTLTACPVRFVVKTSRKPRTDDERVGAPAGSWLAASRYPSADDLTAAGYPPRTSSLSDHVSAGTLNSTPARLDGVLRRYELGADVGDAAAWDRS